MGLIIWRMGSAGIPVGRYLKRHGNKAQKNLTREERLKGSALKYSMKGGRCRLPRDVVLLDDVMTTGTTLRSCAAVLKEHGVVHVYGMVVCRD